MPSFGLVTVATAVLRMNPAHRAESVSQLLFGERVKITSSRGQWIQVENQYDEYTGWVLRSQIMEISSATFRKNLLFQSAGINDRITLLNNQGVLRLSPGSELFLLKGDRIKWPMTSMTFKGKKLNRNKAVFSEENIHHWVGVFMGTPYLWGGRSLSGIDCSGLTQIIFKLMGFQLPRDACQQALVGENVHFLQDARCGDLAFFDNDNHVINHVGILLDNKTIVHCAESSGRVVKDKIDANGIISTTLNVRTHQLRFVNRYF